MPEGDAAELDLLRRTVRGFIDQHLAPLEAEVDAADDVPDEVMALLVSGDREGGRGGLLEAQPRVEQGRVAAQASGIGGHGPQSAPVPRADRPHHRASTVWPRSRPIE